MGGYKQTKHIHPLRGEWTEEKYHVTGERFLPTRIEGESLGDVWRSGGSGSCGGCCAASQSLVMLASSPRGRDAVIAQLAFDILGISSLMGRRLRRMGFLPKGLATWLPRIVGLRMRMHAASKTQLTIACDSPCTDDSITYSDCPGGIKCPKCGICNPEGSSYCGNCFALLQVDTPIVMQQVFSVVEQKPDEPDALHCEDCGTELKTQFEKLVGLCLECWRKRQQQ
jgi:hypothetical protein